MVPIYNKRKLWRSYTHLHRTLFESEISPGFSSISACWSFLLILFFADLLCSSVPPEIILFRRVYLCALIFFCCRSRFAAFVRYEGKWIYNFFFWYWGYKLVLVTYVRAAAKQCVLLVLFFGRWINENVCRTSSRVLATNNINFPLLLPIPELICILFSFQNLGVLNIFLHFIIYPNSVIRDIA